jgi:hypothetical protein
MASDKQIAANRANAKKSGGPNTVTGKAQARFNALRHGLSIPISRDPASAGPIGDFARELVGDEASEQELTIAHIVAEAQFELARVQQCREHTFNQVMTSNVDPQLLQALASLSRYEQRAIGRRNKALRRLEQMRKLPLFG